MINNPALSIVVVNYNTTHLVNHLLDSIKNHLENIDFEVIIVDNASTDGLHEILKAEFPITLLENENNLGFSVANNQGLKKSRGEFVWFLNSDTILIDHSPLNMIDRLKDDRSVGAVGCKLITAEGKLQRSSGITPNLSTEFLNKMRLDRLYKYISYLGKYKYKDKDYYEEMEVEWLSGACILTRTSIMSKVQGFDENIPLFYEDVDLCKRIRDAGYKLLYIPDATIVHYHGSSWRAHRESSIKKDAWSSVYFHRKHSSRATFMGVRALIVVSNVIRIFGLLLFSPFITDIRNVFKPLFRGYLGAIIIGLGWRKNLSDPFHSRDP